MIYMPVCGCDGVMYANSCLADCADVPWTPAIPNGMPGGFLPCNQPSICEVEIDGDSIICNWGIPHVLEASPSANSNPFVSYVWSTGQTGHILTVNSPGTYCVVATDSTGSSDSACFTVSVQEIEIYTVPSPPIICLGDSIVMEIDPALNDIVWNTGDTLDRVVIYPTSSSTYVVEAFDLVGCERRGEVFVEVDTCAVQGMEDLFYKAIVIYPNPTTSDVYIDLPTNATFSLRIFNLIGEEVYSNTDIKNQFSFNSTTFSKGYYTIQLRHSNTVINRKIIIR